jgi:hypothetical protein
MSQPIAEAVEQDTLPALFEHCQNVYKRMDSEAVLYTPPEGTPGEAHLIWEGYLTKLFASLHLSVPYYTSVTRELKRMGCVRQKRRGGGNAPSQWEIVTEPTEELFRSDMNRTQGLAAKKRGESAMLRQQVHDMSLRLSKVEADYEAIIDILVEKEKA